MLFKKGGVKSHLIKEGDYSKTIAHSQRFSEKDPTLTVI